MRAGNRPRSIARRSRSAVPRAAISRATTSRGASSSVNLLTMLVQKRGALPAKRLGEKQRRVDEGRGMELHELEVGECRSRAIGRSHPLSDRARRIRGPLPERRSTAGGEQRGASGDGSTVGDDAHTPLVRAPEREHLLALGYLDSWMGESSLRQAREPRDRRSRRRRRVPRVAGCVRPPGRAPRRTRRRARRDRGSVRQPLSVSTSTALSDGTVRDRSEACLRHAARPSRRRPTAAAIPPWASWLFDDRRDPFVRTRTSPSAAAHKRRNEPGDSTADDDEVECFLVTCAVFRAHASFSL